jgi:hypothetical protein
MIGVADLFPSEFAAGGGLCTSQRSTGGNLGQPGGSGGFSEVGAAACARAGQAAGAKGHLYWGSLPRTRDEPAKEVSNSRGPPAPLQAATRAALGLLALDRTWLRPLATLWRPRAPQPRPRTSPPATPLGAAPGQRLCARWWDGFVLIGVWGRAPGALFLPDLMIAACAVGFQAIEFLPLAICLQTPCHLSLTDRWLSMVSRDCKFSELPQRLRLSFSTYR